MGFRWAYKRRGLYPGGGGIVTGIKTVSKQAIAVLIEIRFHLMVFNETLTSLKIEFISILRVSQGFWGTREHWQNIEGNKGTLANFWEQGTKFRKITVRKHSERVWEHGNIGQFWKGTREQGPPLEDPQYLEQN